MRRLRVVWVNAWVDPGKEKDGVAALVAQGADVISGSPNTPVQGLAAEEKGVWAIGSTGDFSAYVKKAQLTSFELDWSAAHIEAAKAVMEDKLEAEHALARAGPRRLRQDDDQQSGTAARTSLAK